MVPKQTIQVQEDHEERALRIGWRAQVGPAPDFRFSVHSLGHEHDPQRPTGALRRIHEQFCPLVSGTSAGCHAQDSTDVTYTLGLEGFFFFFFFFPP